MILGAESYRSALCSGLFTHYQGEEDASMTSGKLDEELARASRIIDAMRPGGLVLFNESFAATNEREGSQIARHVVGALLDAGIRVALVTHLYDLASTLYAESPRPRGQAVADRRGSGRSSSARPDGDATAAPYPG